VNATHQRPRPEKRKELKTTPTRNKQQVTRNKKQETRTFQEKRTERKSKL